MPSALLVSQTQLLTLVLALIILITFFGNVLVCLSVIKVRKLRHPSNYLLISLAISDLCVACVVMPFGLYTTINETWRLGPLLCNIYVLSDVTSCTASILNLCVISIDRYLAITRPLTYCQKRTTRLMLLLIGGVWALACLISVPPLLITGNEHGTPDEPKCEVSQSVYYQVYATMCSFYVPGVVMIFIYYNIYTAAKKVVEAEQRATTGLQVNHQSRQMSKQFVSGSEPASDSAAVQQANSNSNSRSCWRPSGRLKLSAPSQRANCQQQQQKPKSAKSASLSGGLAQLAAQLGSKRASSNASANQLQLHSPIANQQQHLIRHQQNSINANQNSMANELATPSSSLMNNSSNSGAPISTMQQQASQQQQQQQKSSVMRERKASITLGVIMSAFTICWLPFFIIALTRPFSEQVNSLPRAFVLLTLWLGYANSLLNPIIYVTFHHDFRNAFKHLLCFRCMTINEHIRKDEYKSQYGDTQHQENLRNKQRLLA